MTKIIVAVFLLLIISRPCVSHSEDIHHVSIIDFGANGEDEKDDTLAIQQALNQADGQTKWVVRIPQGKYILSDSLKIKSNTTLLAANGALLKRNESYSPMIINNTTGSPRYTANKNITINGGIWEGNYDKFPSDFCIMLFGHMENITVQNAILLHDYNSHHIELNAVNKATITNNLFDGYKGDKKKEALQIDLAKNNIVFPPFGPYDDTPSTNIVITNNTFKNQSRGIGSHSYSNDVFHTNIVIRNNTFTNIRDEAIKMLQYNNVEISNNLFYNVGLGIAYELMQPLTSIKVAIVHNTFIDTPQLIYVKGFTNSEDILQLHNFAVQSP